jgi:hypothetical protein
MAKPAWALNEGEDITPLSGGSTPVSNLFVGGETVVAPEEQKQSILQQAIKKRQSNVEEIFREQTQGELGGKKIFGTPGRVEAGVKATGQALGLIGDVASIPAQWALSKPIVQKSLKSYIASQIPIPLTQKQKEKAVEVVVGAGLDALSNGSQAYNDWKAKSTANKLAGERIETVFNWASGISTLAGAGMTAQSLAKPSALLNLPLSQVKSGAGTALKSDITKATSGLRSIPGKIGRAGVSQEFKTAISQATPEELDKVITATKARATDLTAPNPSSVFQPDVDDAFNKLQTLRNEASTANKAAKMTGKAKVLPGESAVTGLDKELRTALSDKGAIIKNGKIVNAPGAISTLTDKDQKILNQFISSVNKLKGEKASKTVTGIERALNEAVGAEGLSSEAKAILYRSSSAAKSAIRPEIPAMAEAASKYSDVNKTYTKVKNFISTEKGTAKLLEKSVSDPDVYELVKNVDRLTGSNLSNKSVLLRFASNITNPTAQQSLASVIAGQSAPKATEIVNKTLGQFIRGTARKIVSPEKGARALQSSIIPKPK